MVPHHCVLLCSSPDPPTVTAVQEKIGVLNVTVAPPGNSGGLAIKSYRIVGVPVHGGSNITVSGAGTAAGGGQVRDQLLDDKFQLTHPSLSVAPTPWH